MGSRPDGRIYRPLFKSIISRHTISALPMAIAHNARNCTVASHKSIRTIHDARPIRKTLGRSKATSLTHRRKAQVTTPPSLWRKRPSTSCRVPHPQDPFLRVTQRPPCTLRVMSSPGQLHSPHSTGLLSGRVTGSPLLYHTDCLSAGITDLASTPGITASPPASHRLHPAKVIRYFDRITTRRPVKTYGSPTIGDRAEEGQANHDTQ